MKQQKKQSGDSSRGKPLQITRLRLRISSAAETQLRAGHPWVYADSIREQNRDGTSGELAVIYDRKDKFLAVGLFDPDSPIRLRVLHLGKPQTIDEGWWAAHLEETVQRRRNLFDAQTNGYRIINGESDSWPGLVLDRYDQTLVMKLYAGVWLPRLDEISRLLLAQLKPKCLVLRLSRNVQAQARKSIAVEDGQILFGDPLQRLSTFLESGLHFEADVCRGQKTGFFLDQRENRRTVESLAARRRMLNAFSFSGGFSLYAARGGASSVTDLDISAHALESARRNFGLNESVATVARCRHELVQADAFDWLSENESQQFGLIVLDPPSFAKRESERAGAIRAYERLAGLGIQHLSPDGILVSCSCSAHVTPEEFFEAVRQSAAKSGKTFRELRTVGHALDHPATFQEANYLKAIYLRMA
jgi:23S rRNA (cytosine1962-C5)-methyltransferase